MTPVTYWVARATVVTAKGFNISPCTESDETENQTRKLTNLVNTERIRVTFHRPLGTDPG